MMNSVGGWIVNPSMPQMFHPMFNPQQQYGNFFFINEILSISFSDISIIHIDVESSLSTTIYSLPVYSSKFENEHWFVNELFH